MIIGGGSLLVIIGGGSLVVIIGGGLGNRPHPTSSKHQQSGSQALMSGDKQYQDTLFLLKNLGKRRIARAKAVRWDSESLDNGHSESY